MAKPCKRGMIAERNRFGHCLCVLCKQHRSDYRNNHPRSEYQKDWKRKNQDKCKSYSRAWIERNPEKRREIETSWKARNPDRVKEMNRKGGKKWTEENRGKRLSIVRRYQLRKKQRTPIWADLKKIDEIYIKCQRLRDETGIAYEVDHVVPLAGKFVSGLHVHNNLQIVVMSHNRSKGNKHEQ